MNVIGKPADDAFSPFRGTDEQIQSFPKQNGAVYFAYDTRRIYFDREGQRYQMSGNGIVFVYGHEENENIIMDSDRGLYQYPRESILNDYYEINSIIINSDGTFYKIVELDDLIAYCEKMLVAGSGGGGGGSSGGDDDQIASNLFLTINFPQYHPYGDDLIASAKVTDQYGGVSGILTVWCYNTADDYKADLPPRFVKYIPFNVGEPFDIEIGKDELVPGDKNYFICQAEVDLAYSGKRTALTNCVAVYFNPSVDWNPVALLDPVTKDVEFPYIITAGKGSELPENLDVTVNLVLTNGLSNAQTSETFHAYEDVGVYKLNTLLATIPQGGHTLQVTASIVVAGNEIIIGDFFYGIGVYKHITTGEEAKPIIWSPYNETEVENYTIIKIPYNVFDPTRTDNKAYVEFYVNNEEQVPYTVDYQTSEWNTWTIAEYKVEAMNSFIIQCGLSFKEFQVYIKRNLSVNLDAIQNDLVLYLNTLGRSNLETSARRASWPNKGTTTNTTLGLGDITFTDFNWANNGWMEDDEGHACLRVSNGASVNIPLTTMASTKPSSFTYEFDFKVRNATDYSRLIIEKARPVDKDGNFTDNKDEYQYDEDGTLITEQEKTVSTGDGAFLTYFNSTNKRGFMLGTQEAFFSTSGTAVINARYADKKRVKISIVVDSDGSLAKVYNSAGKLENTIPMVYFYVNGVLTNIMDFDDNTAFDNAVTSIDINSQFCDVDIYNIRVYQTALNYQNITQNWVGDAPTLEERHARYAANNAIVTSNAIDYTKVRAANIIPTMVISTYLNDSVGEQADNKLPYRKGNKKAVGVRFYNPSKPEMSFHAQNVELDVQGTSSQGYPRRNYKLKTKEKISGVSSWTIPYKIETWDGDEAKKNYWYQDNNDTSKIISKGKIDIGNGVAVREFCLKADYMESSSTHNTQFANYVQTIANSDSEGKLGLRHPLKKDFGFEDEFRTTVFGFPILVFWEDVDGNISYVGKYNFNIDKGATDAFGFSFEEENPYSESIVHEEVWMEDESGNKYLGAEIEARKSTFAELAECWEFGQNQSGLGKFQGTDFYELIPKGEDNEGRYQIYNHFEPRYTYFDWDIEDLYKYETDNASNLTDANAYVKKRTTNFKAMWDWVNSTDTTAVSNPPAEIPTVYYNTLSKEYEHNVTYYLDDQDNLATIIPVLSYEDEERTKESSTVSKYAYVGSDETSIANFEKFLADVNDALTEEEIAQNIHQYEKYVGPYTFIQNADDDLFYYTNEAMGIVREATACGIFVPEGRTEFTLQVHLTWDGFSTSLKERFDEDSVRYRKAKFKNGLSLHFDLNYMAVYFILTELLLCYDSRQKNMMIATWGPTANSQGNYIWYPIFYDIDTQLGVNNSGHVSWDYDTDATLISVDPETGKFIDDSIFSGAGSVLWINFAGLFMEEIKILYRSLRNAGAISPKTLIAHYNTNGSSAWSEIMKNIDADYKYIAPACTGYTNQKGEEEWTSGYFYCLQGDRALSREAFFTNRVNYIDSEWLGGDYDPSATNKQIKLRYNANDRLRTPDGKEGFNASATFDLHAYLSQYLSVIYDETATLPQKYIAGQDDPVTVEPPASIKDRLNDGVPLSQQLAYIRGPEYVSDLGDLSDKYINDLDYTPAIRLRRFKLGSLKDGYYNDNVKAAMVSALSVEPGENAKGLLKYMDLSNLSQLSGNLKLTGCEKLETLMATGTTLSSVSFTEGNMLKSLYLPKTVVNLTLKQPLELRGLLKTAPTLDNTPTGLYVENLTDKLDVDITNSTSCRIDTLVLETTKMGIDSYRLLKYLYEVKEKKLDGTITDADTTSNLSCDLTNVEWSPYQQLEIDATWKEGVNYYELKNGTKYETWNNGYYNSEKWQKGLNDGVLYIKNTKFDTTVLQDLDIIKHFINMYKDGNYTVEQGTYRYKSSYNDKTNQYAKILPGLSGRIHVNNAAGGDAVDEYEVWEWTTKNKYYPELEITGDTVTEAYSVHFIEYKKAEDEAYGTANSLEWLKYKSGTLDSPAVYSGEEPSRLHYVFQGWAVDNETLRDKGSVITDEDTDIEVFKTEDLPTKFPSMSAIDGGRLTLVAIFKIRGYNMTFYNDDGTVFGTKVIAAGQPVEAPEGIPYKDDTALDLRTCYKFIGWHVTNDSSEDITDLSRILAANEMNFFAKFTTESVYNNVLDNSCFDIIFTTNTNYEAQKVDGYAATIALKPSLGLGGKLCLPIYVEATHPVTQEWTRFPVAGIAEASLNGETTNGFENNAKLFAVFFKGCEAGATEKPQITRLVGFRGCPKLVWVDIPDSVIAIMANAFSQCPKLEIDNLNNVTSVGQQAFYQSATTGNAYDMNIKGGSLSAIYTDAFVDSGWQVINLGSLVYPFTANDVTALSRASTGPFGKDNVEYDADGLPIVYLQKINIICDQSSISLDEVESYVPNWVTNFDAHVQRYSDFITVS